MAGEGGPVASIGGRGHRVRLPGGGKTGEARVEFPRGTEVPGESRCPGVFAAAVLLIFLLAFATIAFAADSLLFSRVWPAQEYTRVTLESAKPIKHQYFFVKDPERLVVDLEGVDVNDALKGLPAKVGAND